MGQSAMSSWDAYDHSYDERRRQVSMRRVHMITCFLYRLIMVPRSEINITRGPVSDILADTFQGVPMAM